MSVTQVEQSFKERSLTYIISRGNAAAIAATNIFVNGGQAIEGIYAISVYMETTNAQSGTGNAAFKIGYHTPSGAKSLDATGAPFTLVANGSLSSVAQAIPNTFYHDGTANITFQTTYTATGQYDLYIVLEHLVGNV